MKHGKRPTIRQKSLMNEAGLNPKEWLVTKNLDFEIHIVHKQTKEEKVIAA
jgi:hypothetical protein